MQPGATAVPPLMTAPAVDNEPNHFQYQQPQPWMSQQQHFQQPWMNQQQQQWMNQQQAHQPFQYHPQQAMYYHQQLPPHGATQPQLPAAQPTNPDEVRSLWIGDLPTWLDEQFIIGCFGLTGEVVSAKVIRNKQTGHSEGYGFIECVNHAAAERILQSYNGTPIPNAGQNFRLNWAYAGSNEKRSDGTPDFTVFVGDLSPDVTDDVLLETFRVHYTSIKGAKVVMDRLTGRPKGYGFVRFADENEQLRAMSEMNGQLCSTRPMRVGAALNKKNEGAVPYQTSQGSQGAQSEDDPTNTTIFVGGLNESISDDQLRHVFSPYGQLIHVKIPAGKRCGFVQFAERHSAEEALKMLNGTQLSGQSIRLSWGRNPNKQAQVDQTQWNGGCYYGYAPGYDIYGYTAQPQQDPNLYYGVGAYSGYGNFQQPQQ